MKAIIVATMIASTSIPLPAGPTVAAAQRQQPQPAKPRPRLFKAQDLGLLESPDRVEWQKPDQIMDTLRIAEGSVVADLGAGGGWFTIQLARRVGPNGIVFAEDIQPQMVDFIEQRAQRENLRSVRPILGTATDPLLPPGVDAILIDDVYHELDDPVTFFRNAAKALKPQGLLGVVDYLPGGGGPGPAPEERPDPKAVIAAAEAAGLRLQKREDIPPFVFLLVFERR